MPVTPAATSPRTVYRFGTFELDVQAGELRKAGLRVKLQPQPFQILMLLLESPGELVTREELSEKLWPAETYVEFDRSLNRAVVKLRDTLGDDAESPRFVETVPKRGYRFIAPVTRSPLAGTEPEPPVQGSSRPWWKMLVLALTLLAVGTGTYLIVRQGRRTPAASIRSIVVLPLENLSNDPNQEYLADGVTDELITDLAKVQSVRVVSRTTAMHYKGTRESLAQIARELGIDAAVEGTVSRSANKIRIRAQLVRSATDEHIWANTYERDVTDAVALQTEVARDIANQISMKLTPGEKAALASSRTTDAGAYEAYLKARYLFDKRTIEADRESIELYQKAIALDPNFAAAYAGLADSLALRSYLGDVSPQEIMTEARAAIDKALELDSDSVEAHLSSAWMKLGYEWKWAGANQEIQRALELNPNSSAAHQANGIYQLSMGRVDQGIGELQKALELDPLSPYINRDLGRALYYAHLYDDALKQLQRTLDLEPRFGGVVRPWMSWCYEKQGKHDEAIEAFLETQRADGAPDATLREQRQLYREKGWKEYWRRQVQHEPAGPLGSTQYFTVLAYARLGDKENALRLLRREVELRTIWISWINIDPELDNLRSDLRFQKLLRETGR